MLPAVRDQIVDFVRRWRTKTELATTQFVQWLGVAPSKWYDWCGRYGQVNHHNAWVPRDHWLLPAERDAILTYHAAHPDDGYRRLTFMMLDADVVAVSPTTTYRVLREAGRLRRWHRSPAAKGRGFQQPLLVHEHWHVDLTYLKLGGTFYYLCVVLDGYSRFVIHWELREQMTERDVEITLQRAREQFPEARPRIISDNGAAFIAKDFKEFIRLAEMTHVTTSPAYPQSNGKVERWNQSFKVEGWRPGVPVGLADGLAVAARYVRYYNTERLHAGIGYVTPEAMLQGRQATIFAARNRKLEAARARRAAHRAIQPEAARA